MRVFVFLAVLTGSAAAQGPVYTAEGFVNSASFRPGRLAANSHVTVFGDFGRGPTRVLINNQTGRIYHSSATQMNFYLPEGFPGRWRIQIGNAVTLGAAVTVDVMESAPELYAFPGEFAAATHADGRLITEQWPAVPGQIVTLYGTAFGPISTQSFGLSRLLTPLDVFLDGQVVRREDILYMGQAGRVEGLYQINLRLPEVLAADPLIQLGVRGEPSSRTGLRLMVRPPAAQP